MKMVPEAGSPTKMVQPVTRGIPSGLPTGIAQAVELAATSPVSATIFSFRDIRAIVVPSVGGEFLEGKRVQASL